MEWVIKEKAGVRATIKADSFDIDIEAGTVTFPSFEERDGMKIPQVVVIPITGKVLSIVEEAQA